MKRLGVKPGSYQRSFSGLSKSASNIQQGSVISTGSVSQLSVSQDVTELVTSGDAELAGSASFQSPCGLSSLRTLNSRADRLSQGSGQSSVELRKRASDPRCTSSGRSVDSNGSSARIAAAPAQPDGDCATPLANAATAALLQEPSESRGSLQPESQSEGLLVKLNTCALLMPNPHHSCAWSTSQA
jgi:hypothetical protein